MWKVIRHRQGLEPNAPPPRRDTDYAAHQRCIQLHEVRPDVPYMSPIAFSKAYGEFVFVKIRRWLLDERTDVRLQAAEHLIELYTEKREHSVQSLSYDLLPILLATLEKDESPQMRERAGMALELLVRETATQRLLLLEDGSNAPTTSTGRSTVTPPCLLSILASLRDTCEEVIIAGLRVVLSCHAWQNAFAVTAALVDGGLTPILIDLILSPNTSAQVFACSAARQLFQVKEAHVEFLKLGGISTLTSAITHTEAVALVAEAAEVVSLAAEYAQGRRDAVACGTLAALQPYLQNPNLTLRVAVYSAAAQVAVLESAKRQATEAGYPALLVQEMRGEDERDVLMHMLRLVYHIAEWPAARLTLRECLPRVTELQQLAEGDEALELVLAQATQILKRNVAPA